MTAQSDATGNPETSVGSDTLENAIDDRPLGSARIVSLILCALVMLVDGYDLAAMPLAVPHVVRAWGVEASSFSVALASAPSCSRRSAIGWAAAPS
jgi:hypothetical protein